MEIVIKYDTSTKAMTVTAGGKSLANVNDISFYSKYDDKDEYYCSISMIERDADEGTATLTRLCVSEGVKVDKLAEAVAKASKLEADILKYFSKG